MNSRDPFPTLGLAALLAAIVSLALSASASADARYVKSAPAPNSTVGATIQAVTVVYSEDLEPRGSSLAVFGPDGARADQADASLDSMSRRVMRASLKPGLRPGRYTVRWTAVSARDGSAASGSFAFAISPFVSSAPAPGSDVKGVPDTVTVVFARRLNPQGSSIAVTGDDGARADRGDGRVDPADPEGKTMRVSLEPGLRPGKYFVRWTAALAEDGSVVSDSFGFTTFAWQPASEPAARTGPSAAAQARGLPRAGGLPVGAPVLAGLALLGAGLLLRRAGP